MVLNIPKSYILAREKIAGPDLTFVSGNGREETDGISVVVLKNCDPQPLVSVSLGKSLEMPILGPRPRLPKSEPVRVEPSHL